MAAPGVSNETSEKIFLMKPITIILNAWKENHELEKTFFGIEMPEKSRPAPESPHPELSSSERLMAAERQIKAGTIRLLLWRQ